jgi:signal transduction histidine kinase
LLDSNRKPIGMLSTHFASVHHPTDESLRLLDLYARQAASFVQQCSVERRLLEGEDRLRQLNAQLEDRVRERTSEVQALLARLVAVQDQERHRIALDIHDHLGQQMTALRMHLAVLKERTNRDPALALQTERIEKIAEALDISIDAITSELRPAALEELGLRAALADLVGKWSERFGVTAGFHTSDECAQRVSREAEAQLYFVAQEALHNVAKHAQATEVRVTLECRDGHMLLVVEDNGRGFDLSAPRNEHAGLGLVNMRERASLSSGQLEMRSGAQAGTSICVRVPLTVSASGTHLA